MRRYAEAALNVRGGKDGQSVAAGARADAPIVGIVMGSDLDLPTTRAYQAELVEASQQIRTETTDRPYSNHSPSLVMLFRCYDGT
jgi:hypothetical protein